MSDPHESTSQHAAAAPAAPASSSGAGALIAIIVVMLAIGGAIGYFGGTALEEDDAETVAATDTTTTTAAAPAPDPTVWAHPNGTFQVALPEGSAVGSDKYGPGQSALVSRPGDAANDFYDAGGITVAFDRRPDMTPETVLDIDPSSKCPTDGGQEPYAYGDYQGIVHTFTGCPNGFQLRRIAVAVEGGTNLFVTSVTTDGDDAAVERALDTFLPGAQPETQVAPDVGCADIEASTDAEYPLSLVVKNYLDDQVTYGWVDPATDQVDQPTDLPSGYLTGTNFTKAGDVYRFTTPDGDVDYTVTDQQTQCVLLTDDGFEPVPD